MVDQVIKELSSKNSVGWSWRPMMSKWLLIRGWTGKNVGGLWEVGARVVSGSLTWKHY